MRGLGGTVTGVVTGPLADSTKNKDRLYSQVRNSKAWMFYQTSGILPLGRPNPCMSGCFCQTSGYIFHTSGQVLHTGDLSCKHTFKLHLHWYHTATTDSSGQTWKVVVVHFHATHHSLFLWMRRTIKHSYCH